MKENSIRFKAQTDLQLLSTCVTAEISTALKDILQKISECKLKREQVIANGSRITHGVIFKNVQRL